jgi:hypothetical protein
VSFALEKWRWLMWVENHPEVGMERPLARCGTVTRYKKRVGVDGPQSYILDLFDHGVTIDRLTTRQTTGVHDKSRNAYPKKIQHHPMEPWDRHVKFCRRMQPWFRSVRLDAPNHKLSGPAFLQDLSDRLQCQTTWYQRNCLDIK